MGRKTALDVLAALRNSKGNKKAELSKELSKILETEPRNVGGAFLMIVNGIIRSREEELLSDISHSEFWNIRVTTYVDSDGSTRVAAGLAYVQDFENSDPELDNRVMRLILDALVREHLDLVFNDICVNLIQVRNGG